jgi:predicted ATPase/DNA-binding XRE family transcriptional regulator
MAMPQRLTFGELLKRYRAAANFTQDELAERAGLSAKAISALERGERRTPHKDTLVLLSDALDLGEEDRTLLLTTARRERAPQAAQVAPAAWPSSGSPDLSLPAYLTQLIGREREEAGIAHLLLRPDLRLVTLTGPAGIGKTRLALQVAADVHDQFAGGVRFIALAPVRDAELVLNTIAQALGLREGEPALLDVLVAALREQSLLLVLDNFEQVAAAGAALVSLLAACPLLKALVTSRAALRVRGEQEFSVPPLEVPDLAHPPAFDDVARYAAVQLFVECAQAVRPTFELTPELAPTATAICARLDGIPLAIELAAARVKFFSLPALLAGLDQRLSLLTGGAQDLPERQQTMRRAIAWSYDLLSEVERLLFRRLVVFAGSGDLDAIETICDADGAVTSGQASVLDTLELLANKSLVVGELVEEDVSRFRLLELMRAYGLEQMVAVGEQMAQRAHAEYYLALAERAEQELKGQQQSVWLRRLAREHDNLRAALSWAIEVDTSDSGAVELGLRLAGSIWRYWDKLGHLGEGRHWLNKALTQSRDMTDTATLLARAKALYGASVLAHRQHDEEEANALAEELLALHRRLGDLSGVAAALNALAVYAVEAGKNERALALNQESLAIKRNLGDVWGMAASLVNLGVVMRSLGRYGEASTFYEEALELNRQAQDAAAVALSLIDLGEIRLTLGEYERAAALLEEGVTLAREQENSWLVGLGLNNLSVTLRYLGEPERARALALEGYALSERVGNQLERGNNLVELGELARDAGELDRAEQSFREALAIYRDAGSERFVALTLDSLGLVAHLRGDPERALALHRESLSLFRTSDYKLGIADTLEATASDLCALGQAELAATVYGATDAWRATTGAPIPPTERAVYVRSVEILRLALGEVAFNIARQQGAALSLEETLTLVLNESAKRHSDPSK